MSHVAAPMAVRFEHRTDEDPCSGSGPRPHGCPGSCRRPMPASSKRPTRSSSHAAREHPRSSRWRAGSRCWFRGRPPRCRRGSRCGCGCGCAGRGCSRPGATRRRWRPGCSGPGTGRPGSSARASWAGWARRRPCSGRPSTCPAGSCKARLYATAHGLYEARLNGHRVGDQVLAPGWTSYAHRLRYQTYDVTGLVREGGNDLEVLLGNGWYRGRLGCHGRRGHYGDRLALLAQLEVTTSDGAVHAWAPTPPGRPARAGSWPMTSTTASGPTCVPGPTTAAAPSRWSTPTWLAWSRPTARRCGSPRPCPRPPSSPRRPAPPWSTSGRTSSAGCGSGSGTRPRARRSWSATPRCWSTGSWGSGRCGPPRPPTPTCWPAGRSRCWSRA